MNIHVPMCTRFSVVLNVLGDVKRNRVKVYSWKKYELERGVEKWYLHTCSYGEAGYWLLRPHMTCVSTCMYMYKYMYMYVHTGCSGGVRGITQ